MKVKPLAAQTHPDFNDLVVHFTGRSGSSNRSFEVSLMSAKKRLIRILSENRLRAFQMFGTSARAVCFTEATRRGAQWLIKEGRYQSCGLALGKDAVFSRGGGPALYIRGDEWEHADAMPELLRARATRFWPGADPGGDEVLPFHLAGRSEWTIEREWRAAPNEHGDWVFDIAEVQFLVLPDHDFFDEFDAGTDDPDRSAFIRSLPHLIIAPNGEIAHNERVPLRATSKTGRWLAPAPATKGLVER